MKNDSRRSQRVADLVRSELSLLVLTEAHDPELRRVTISKETPLHDPVKVFQAAADSAVRAGQAPAIGATTQPGDRVWRRTRSAV